MHVFVGAAMFDDVMRRARARLMTSSSLRAHIRAHARGNIMRPCATLPWQRRAGARYDVIIARARLMTSSSAAVSLIAKIINRVCFTVLFNALFLICFLVFMYDGADSFMSPHFIIFGYFF